MKLFYYENFFFYLNMITIFCKLIFTKKRVENREKSYDLIIWECIVISQRIDPTLENTQTLHFVSIVSKFIANWIDMALIISGLDDSWYADRKKADYQQPSLWIYTPSISLNLVTYFTLSIDEIHQDQILKRDKLIKKGTCIDVLMQLTLLI